jgi:hypothetical protein
MWEKRLGGQDCSGNTLLGMAGTFRTTREEIVSTYCILTGCRALCNCRIQPVHRDAGGEAGEARRRWMPGPARSRWIERRAGIGFQNEHAETGKPDASSDEDESRGDLASNGPAHDNHLVGMGLVMYWRERVAGDSRWGGHKLSASGSPHRNTRITGMPLGMATARRVRRSRPFRFASHGSVIPQSQSHPPSRPRASLPHLADCPSRRMPLGGKARWQKRFVFPARRMRRGLRF